MHDSPVSGRRWIFVAGSSDSGTRSQRPSDLLPNCTSLPMTEDSGAKNSPNCEYPLATSRAFRFSIVPSSLYFVLKTHLLLMAFLCGGKTAGSHDWFLRWDANSSLMALSHSLASGRFTASS
ncbi:hypothetical protein T10_6891 [Trichinella papuae]|uniref:Uncharacterized protein n=1 Tax=Trichinella papuae TaxID=268474 RepID=A0A0V1MRQ4_9BILA|nr:hypothetical protein T10_6891 [Trichinella papuae]